MPCTCQMNLGCLGVLIGSALRFFTEEKRHEGQVEDKVGYEAKSQGYRSCSNSCWHVREDDENSHTNHFEIDELRI